MDEIIKSSGRRTGWSKDKTLCLAERYR